MGRRRPNIGHKLLQLENTNINRIKDLAHGATQHRYPQLYV